MFINVSVLNDLLKIVFYELGHQWILFGNGLYGTANSSYVFSSPPSLPRSHFNWCWEKVYEGFRFHTYKYFSLSCSTTGHWVKEKLWKKSLMPSLPPRDTSRLWKLSVRWSRRKTRIWSCTNRKWLTSNSSRTNQSRSESERVTQWNQLFYVIKIETVTCCNVAALKT